MKGIVVTLITLAIVLTLILGVIMPIANKSKTSGTNVIGKIDTTNTQVDNLATPIWTAP